MGTETTVAHSPAPRRYTWIAVGGFGTLGILAVLLGIWLGLIPLHRPPAPTAAEPQKLVVRYALVAPLAEGKRRTGPTYIAEVRGDNELVLSFEIGGLVERIGPDKGQNWENGTRVTAGTVLAKLKPDDFVNRVKAAQSRVELARLTHQRFQNLVKTQSIPREKLDQATAEKTAAEAELATAEQTLQQTVLRAPADGTILARLVSPAEIVAPGKPVMRFSNLRRMSVEVGVPDTVVGHVRVGQEVPIVVSALAGRSFTGHVVEVGVAGEEGSRLFRIKLKVPNPDGAIRSGMTASVSFAPLRPAPADAVWVPLAALTTTETPEQLAVYVVDSAGVARRRMVRTDEIAGNLILVTRGLAAGEKVVVVGVAPLYDGAPVDARPVEDSFN